MIRLDSVYFSHKNRDIGYSFFFIEKICCCFKSVYRVVYRGGNYLLLVLSSARKKLLLSVQGQSYSPSTTLSLSRFVQCKIKLLVTCKISFNETIFLCNINFCICSIFRIIFLIFSLSRLNIYKLILLLQICKR